MTSRAIRQSFLEFFEERGHTIVPSSPVVPYDDPTLLFTNAGMNQFKDVFLGTGRRPYARAVNTQKCIRVSGKHNDLEEVGRDTYHHTFFEMLGNWSFGDPARPDSSYYKKEAIAWAWELLTHVWHLPKNRLWATVYTDDAEAEQLWKSVTDIRHDHVLRFGEKDNFWEMGETGPCGPCSEIHFDRTPAGNASAELINAGTPGVIEIWNLVFIQYNRDASGTLTPLPAKHVDTGMGFERICAVLQDKNSNYDTDIFTPLLDAIATLTKQTYGGSLTSEIDIAFRVIADHIRALTFAIADGALPSNEGRGYVLRRILRRAARFGRSLQMHEPFIFKLVPTLVATMGDVFPEISEKQNHIQNVVKGEEEGFNATLDRGLEIFDDILRKAQRAGSSVIAGAEAFKLYDTYGFPLDLTQLLAREHGLSVDEETFNHLMEKQRERSRTGTSVSIASEEVPGIPKDRIKTIDTTAYEQRFVFVGYDELEAESPILFARDRFLILERTPFYGESGGQVGDTGIVELNGDRIPVVDTQKSGNVHVHILKSLVKDAAHAKARVDKDRRAAIMRNHTATHLVHAALRKILGTHVHQAGSLVAPDYLRFDFAHFSRVSESELADIEALVNQKIAEDIPLMHYRNIPFEEARKMGALMFFGDKYGERVNVVEFGEFSREFCGGTHVRRTAEIGYFKFRTEGSVASGIRRVEAVTHDAARELLRLQDQSLHDRIGYAFQKLEELTSLYNEFTASGGEGAKIQVEFTSFEEALKQLQQGTARHSMGEQFADLSHRAAAVEDIILKLAEKERKLKKELSSFRLQEISGRLDELIRNARHLNGFRLVTARVPAASMEELKSIGDALRAKMGSGIGVLASVLDKKVALVCVVTDDLLTKGILDAGKVVGSIARIVGGGGAGKPHLATAGGKDITKLDDALRQTEFIVKSFLHPEG